VPASPAYATLLTFGRYVDKTGPAKATFVGGLRRARETGAGFNPHARFVKALKDDIRWRAGGARLAAAVDTVSPRWRPLYAALHDGALRYLASLGDPCRVGLAEHRDAIGVIGPLSVKINPQLGLRYDDGRAELVRLHFDEHPPSSDLVLATLHLMSRHMHQLLPKATPVLADLRRGVAYRPDAATRPDDVERWLAGEAAAFATMWTAA
jgi:hypothetical protein